MNNHKHTYPRQARDFDRATLIAIYDDYHQPVYRYIYRQVGDVETSRDLTAEVFGRFLQAVEQGKGPVGEVLAWLYLTSHNAVVDHYRRQQHRQHLPLDEELVDAASDPVSVAEDRISVQQIRAALRQLTPDQQQVVTLKFLEGLSTAEVAAVLNKPVGAVKSLQHRALAALQRHLIPDEERIPL